ncbi:MAG: enoyl-CoA hydratase / 3-hydroxyacyl-CoA dehydrogenase [Solirubrobacterales bacterium]|jgi:enoyl-CoA hydratase/3-hydroxyacyl-CoA dehydrogenase|nr:enoyl-CoA hydratase / 3-hydroxyacyl-CoA dehydrogenase [Solirubrobacterales bacterium]
MFVFKAAVLGGGTMGGEIAQVIASADIPVVVKDVEQKFVDHALEKSREVTKSQLDKLVSKEKLTQEQADARLDEVMGLITGTTTYEEFGDVDMVIEAVPERMEIKKSVYRELDEATPGHAILASNTSSLSITEMGRETLRPGKVAGFHFFFPASVMPLVEIIAGEDTSRETITTCFNFAQAIRKQGITCKEVPGFVVNRILNSGVGEVWREQEEKGLSIKKIDEGIAGANVTPMGPFFLIDMLGLDTVLHVAEYLNDSYGDRFYVHKGMQKLVADGKLGAKSGGEGFYKDGEPNIEGDADPNTEELADLLMLKSFVEACMVLEEGVCTVREIDLGMMAGAGLDPRRGLFPPFWKADLEGLDTILEKLEKYEESHGERFAPPRTLKRLVAQGRLGLKTGQGFYAYPQGEGEGAVKLEKRGEVAIAWLANPPMNAISPTVIEDLGKVWEQVKADDEIKAMVVYSSLPVVYSAGADIKAFTQMDTPEKGAELINNGHALLKELGESRVSTVAAVNAIAYGGGCELSMACDFRVAAESAVFGQPEINLGIIPGFGGTQRLPRLVGESKAKEMNLTGDAVLAQEAREIGLADDLVADEELLDTAISWARKLAGQAPLAVEEIKQVSNKGDLDEGIEAEKQGFAKVFLSEDGREGISAFLQKRKAKWQGK